MLGLPPLDISTWSARAAVYEGYNDAFVPTSPSTSPTEAQVGARGSPLTGADAALQFANTGTRATHSILLNGRVFRYTPPSPSPSATGISALLAYSTSLAFSPTTTISLNQSALWGDQDALHAADTPLTALDLARGRRQFALSTTGLTWTHEIDGADRERVSATATFQDTTRDESLLSAHTGFEYASATVAPGYSHDFSGRDTGDFTANFRWFYMPAAIIDIDGNRGTTTTLQVEPRVTWVRTSSEDVSRSLFGGLSLASATTNGASNFFVTPTAGAQINYTRERFNASAGYTLGFSPLTSLSLPGITNAVNGRIAGEPWESGFARRWITLGMLLGGIGYMPTGAGSIIQTTVGAGVTLIVPLVRQLGMYLGYEGRLNRASGGLFSSAALQVYQNLVYVGLTGILSSDPDTVGVPTPRIQR